MPKSMKGRAGAACGPNAWRWVLTRAKRLSLTANDPAVYSANGRGTPVAGSPTETIARDERRFFSF